MEKNSNSPVSCLISILSILMVLCGDTSVTAGDNCHFPMRLGVKVLDYYSNCRMANQAGKSQSKTEAHDMDDDDDAPIRNLIAEAQQDGLEQCYDHGGKTLGAEFNWRKGDLRKGWVVISTRQKVEFIAKNGTLHGIERVYSPEGRLQCEIPFADGEATGVLREFYPNGSLKQIYKIKNANKEDKGEISFTPEGKLASLSCADEPIHPKDADWCGRGGKTSTIELFTGKKGYKTTLVLRDAKLLERNSIDKSGRRTLVSYPEPGNQNRFDQKEYFPNGKLYRSRSENTGRTVGIYQLYSENGTLLDEVRFNDHGKPMELKSFYLNGKLKSHALRSVGDQQSTEQGVKQLENTANSLFALKKFYDDGTPEHEGVYTREEQGKEDGRPVWEFSRPKGTLRDYRTNGSVLFERTYVDGELEGLSRYIDEEGVRTEEIYLKGVLESRKRFDQAGRLLQEEEFYRDGSRKKFNDYGKGFEQTKKQI